MNCTAFFAALLLIFAPAALPGVAAAEALVAAAPLTDEELAAERGGLKLPTGLEVGFGASVRTFVDGALVLETRLVWTDQGAVQSQSPSAIGPGGQGVTLSGAAESLPGLVVPGDGGSTAVLHELNAERIANIVVNTASNRDIRQEVQIDLAIPELTQFQQSALQERANIQMLDAANSALRDAALR
ncbi:hypothetical protein [Phenylobacterium sp.]|uniref:hypothetical protein n=1 Tax=Phenylobacterium sp. TaxID=1871053 RepID=UPI002897B624|nr:hypothetical protein [Phenylobacterium sp.]